MIVDSEQLLLVKESDQRNAKQNDNDTKMVNPFLTSGRWDHSLMLSKKFSMVAKQKIVKSIYFSEVILFVTD